ncbi:MAG: GNAT family N-acetyltransferase [Coprococcus sp.]|nr:GNAT family N-acetyltransferase [Coprococcus sp.]
MEIRKTKIEDLERILQIYEDARAFMRENGNPTQWGETEPKPQRIRQDIADGDSYVCVDGGKVVGVFFFKVMEETNYAIIYDGAWKDDGSAYGVIHRIAADRIRHGVASFCIGWAFVQSGGHLRIDTHENNTVMQRVLKKNGFQYCGNIFVQDGTKRFAYELTQEMLSENEESEGSEGEEKKH